MEINNGSRANAAGPQPDSGGPVSHLGYCVRRKLTKTIQRHNDCPRYPVRPVFFSRTSLSWSAPAAQNHLAPRVELHSLIALNVQIPEKRLVPACKGKDGHRGGHSNIDTHHTTLNFPRKLSCRPPVTSEDHRAVSIR